MLESEHKQTEVRDQIDRAGNQDYQRKLAISLVSCLGFEGAVHACHANAWDGVLKSVIALREAGGGDTSRA